MRFRSTEDAVRAAVARRGYRLITALGAAGVVLGCGLLVGNGSTSRADDPPKPAEDPDAIARRIDAQHERFMAAFAPLADVFEEREKAVERAKDQRPDQVMTTQDAEIAYQNAKLAREIAEIALKEYESGIFKQEENKVEGRVKSAKAELDRVDIAGRERHLEETLAAQKAFEESRPEPAVKVLGELLIRQAVAYARASVEMEKLRLRQVEFERDTAETDREVLHRFGRSKRIAELKAAIEKAKANELREQIVWDRELKKQGALLGVISGRFRSWDPAEKALIMVLAEVSDLETKRYHLLDYGDRPPPPAAEVEKLLDSIDTKLDEAERAASVVSAARAGWAFTQALTRVRDAAHRLREKP